MRTRTARSFPETVKAVAWFVVSGVTRVSGALLQDRERRRAKRTALKEHAWRMSV
jgi:hypothetical protein